MALAGYDHLLRAADRLRWDDADYDVARDRPDYEALSAAERDRVAQLVAGFCVAEEAVAEHLAPFVQAAADPLLRECFARQADDEARHARFFARVARDVCGLDDPRALATERIVALFEHELPRRAGQLAQDGRLDRAVGLYHLVLEGIVFSIGQAELLAATTELPVTHAGVLRVRDDERWHLGLGVRCLSDLQGAELELGDLAETAANCWDPSSDGGETLRRHRRRLEMVRARTSVTQAGPCVNAA